MDHVFCGAFDADLQTQILCKNSWVTIAEVFVLGQLENNFSIFWPIGLSVRHGANFVLFPRWSCQQVISFKKNPRRLHILFCFVFFSIWVFFHEHSRFTGQQGKGEGINLTPLYHFHPLHRHLDISRAITADSSPLHIAGSRTRRFPSASR